MSEYQHYEFHAIDNPLDAEAMSAVDAMSSRVQLSPRKAVFTYSYGDFRYDPEEVLVDYFDFMLYIANWGTKRMMMKFPPDLVDYDFLKKYRMSVVSSYAQDIRIFEKAGYVIVDIDCSEEEGLGWIDEADYGYDFLNIRREIMKEDYRSLFLIWLRFLEDLYRSDEFDHEYDFEARLIPADLLQLSSSGHAVMEFYGTNPDWLAVMRSYSSQKDEKEIDYKAEIAKLSKDQMITYLQMVLKGDSNLKLRLEKELRGDVNNSKGGDRIKLLEIGGKVSKIAQHRQEQERKERTREELVEMKAVRKHKERIEKEIIDNIFRGNSKAYQLAIADIMRLKAMNDYFDTAEHFNLFVNKIAMDYSRKSSFIRMLKQKNLIDK